MKTIYKDKLNEIIAALKKWQDQGEKTIVIDVVENETGIGETRITAGSNPNKELPVKGISMR